MKLFVLLIILALAACNYTSDRTKVARPLNSKDTTITLKDSLGDIKISIPNRYDTFLIWTHHSDCSNCGREKYRFQSKKLPIYMESGFISSQLEDSIDQLTIEHLQFVRINDSLPEETIKPIHFSMVEEATSDPLMYRDRFLFDTIQKINNKLFSIISSENYDASRKLYSKVLWGTTLIRGNPVKFTFTLLTNRKDSITDNFIKNSKDLLYQVKWNGL